eukprot:SM000654S20149  [mRNA]  locus=s654:25:1538:+ [translate_table: standard]
MAQLEARQAALADAVAEICEMHVRRRRAAAAIAGAPTPPAIDIPDSPGRARAAAQELETEAVRVAAQLRDRDLALRAHAKRLRDVELLLESAVEDYAEYRRPKGLTPEECAAAVEGANGAEQAAPSYAMPRAVDNSALVAYAHRVSYTTLAPPEVGQGAAPGHGVLPPAPQEEQMQATLLYRYANVDLGVGPPVALQLSEAAPLIAEELPLGPAEPPPGWQPEMQLPGLPPAALAKPPPMPPGWRPGMPLPDLELPPMPPGWKPGDPLPLPPLPLAPIAAPVSKLEAVPANQQAQLQQLPPQRSTPPPQGVIHVPFVQLDLNPELEEEYSDEYSEDSDEPGE